MLATMQFKDYHIKEIQYKFDPFYQKEEVKLIPKFDYSLNTNPENNKQAWVTLSFEIGDKSLSSNSIYVLVSISGFFEVEGLEEKEAILNYYRVNAIAILFPYLRGVVSDVTSKGSESPLILPTMNVAAMIQELEEQSANTQEESKI